MKETLENLVTQALKTLSIETESVTFEHPTEISHGDYSTNIALALAKNLKQNPRVLAEKIVAEIQKNLPEEIEKVEIAGAGFINFFLSRKFFVQSVAEILASGQNFGSSKLGAGKQVLIEYSSPNIAKPFGVGHLRSTIIGDAIANLFEFSGYQTIRDNHLGDWGTQFGKQIYAIKTWGDEAVIEKSQSPVKELVALYVKFHEEAEKDPALDDAARGWFTKLEQGDAEARRLWQKCVDWSWIEFNTLYERLGIQFDTVKGESQFEEKMKEVIEDVQKSGIAKESEGAYLIFFPDEKIPPFMILKKDGSTLYSTRDLATDKYRKEKYGSDLVIINEVGAEQTLHFKQLFEAEEILGYFPKTQRKHVAHGLFRLKEGKMSTRKGMIIWLEEVLNEAVARAKEINPESAEMVGVGAIKFNDLKRNPIQDIIFDWEEILDLKGDSGPYVQYTAVRAKSAVEKAKEAGISLQVSDQSPMGTITELEKMLYRFPEVVVLALREFAPNYIATYLIQVAGAFNNFYANNKIVDSDSGAPYRVALTQATAVVLTNGLKLLGIKVPAKM